METKDTKPAIGFNLKDMEVDPSRSEEGVWVAVDPTDDNPEGTVQLLIARMGNPKYNAYLQELVGVTSKDVKGAGARRARQVREKMNEAVSALGNINSTASKKAAARYILLGWKGLRYGDEEVPYSEKKALELFNSPRFPDFYPLVLEFANDQELFKQEAQEEAEGNSPSSSDGNSSGDDDQKS